jgi:hypothetical protein
MVKCDELGDDDLPVMSCGENGPTWPLLSRQLLVAAGVWVALALGNATLFQPTWRRCCVIPTSGAPPLWVLKWVGYGADRPAFNPRPEASLCCVQLLCSGVLVVTWINKAYLQEPATDGLFCVELGAVLLCLAHAASRLVQVGFAWDAFGAQLATAIDCLTLPALVLQRSGPVWGGSWLTLGYLRVFNMLMVEV